MILELQLDPAREIAAIQNYANVKARLYPKPPQQAGVPLSVTIAPPKGRERHATFIGPRAPVGWLSPISNRGNRAKRVIEAVARDYRLKVDDLTGPRRFGHLVIARQVAMYALARGLCLSLPQIGWYLGGRDHTTALHGTKKIERLIEQGKLDDPLPRLFPDRVAV
jgi:hypothetical protein